MFLKLFTTILHGLIFKTISFKQLDLDLIKILNLVYFCRHEAWISKLGLTH